MSTALGLSAVSVVLAHELNSLYHTAPGSGLGGVAVSAVAPDLVQTGVGSGGPPRQVNLFLHQVTHNGAWRNVDLPSLSSDGSRRLTNPPLALDLHYLMTAYASEDYEAEALLGFAVQFLHENPLLTRGDIQTILTSLTGLGLPQMIAASGLADQIELIKLTPSVLGREEMAWLWTALKADYRLTFPFQASVVLIQARNATQVPLPVATRNVAAQAGLLPAITSVVPPAGQAGACQGDSVSVLGRSLGDAVSVVLSNSQLGIRRVIAPDVVKAASVQFSVPRDATGLPAGIYLLSLQVQPPGLSTPISTNSLPFAVAPQITSGLPGSVQGPTFTLQPSCLPNVLSRQQVSLVLGSLEMTAVPFTGSTATPVFNFTNVSPGSYLVRLRVDGIDSPVAFDLSPPSGLLLQVN